MNELTKMKNSELIKTFEDLVNVERRTTANVIRFLVEIDRRKLFLSLGYSSLYAYLTDGLKYSGSAAMRRISAVRLSTAEPDLDRSLASGELNLSQVSVIAQAIRQKQKSGTRPSPEVKKSILEKVKTCNLSETQEIVFRALEIEPTTSEKTQIQADQSLKMTLIFNKDQKEILKRAREILSNNHPHLNWSDLITLLAKDFIARKDPRSPKREYRTTTAAVVKKTADNNFPQSSDRQPLPASVKREVHQRHHSCQYVDKNTQKKCESTFQLQIDHIQPVWAGGSNHIDNLQILCAQHNRHRYLQQSGLRKLNGC